MVGCHIGTPKTYLVAECFVGNCLQVVCCKPIRFQVMRCVTLCLKKKREFLDDLCVNCVCIQILNMYL